MAGLPDSTTEPLNIVWPTNQHKQLMHKERWITEQEMAELPQQEIVLIDVRQYSHPNDTGLLLLSVPITQLANLPFLFNKTVILIGSGFDQISLNQQMDKLTRKGFKHLFALTGGIRTWQKMNHIIENNSLSAEEFLQGGKTIPWQIITIGLTAENEAILPERPIQNFTLTQEAMPQLSKLVHNQSSSNTFICYVLIAPDKQTTQLLKQQISLSSTEKTVWLSGGLAGYQDYIQQQIQQNHNAGKSLSRPCQSTL